MECDDDAIVISCAAITLACASQILSTGKTKQSRNRKIWMKEWLQERDSKSAYANIL